MVQRQPPPVAGHYNKGRAAGVFNHAQTPSQALGQAGFAGAQGAGQQKDGAGGGLRAQDPPHFPGFLGSGGSDGKVIRPGTLRHYPK